MKTICVIAPCFNEAGNITELFERVKAVFEQHPQYDFNILYIDNASTDSSRAEISALGEKDKRVKAIFNSRNFGHIRSPYHALLQAEGDAVVTTVSDLQVGPEIIHEYIKKWEEGYDIIIGVKETSSDSFVMRCIRNFFYYVINKLSDIPLRKNFIGLGLYDRRVVEALKKFHDPYPYFRGLIFEVGFKRAEVPYNYTGRKRGVSSANFMILYDLAMLGIISHSKIPLRLMTLSGFFASVISFMMGCFYLAYKIMYWDSFRIGMAPIMLSIFFFGSIMMMFMGVLGEYIGFIFTKLQNQPHVIEEKRINF